jgi:mono/diheme cytochrome c family protein
VKRFPPLLGMLAVIGLGLWGAASPPAQALPQAPDEVLERGLEVYKAQYCGACHTLPLAGSKGTFGPPHIGMRGVAEARLRSPDYRGEATTPEEYLLESILHPARYLVPGFEMTPHHMPAYALSDEDLAALVALLLHPESPTERR